MREVYRIGELVLATDLSPVRWIIEQTHGFAVNVGSLVPAGFSSYVRVLHPAYRQDAATPTSDPTRITWAEIARANGRIIHSEVQFDSLGHAPLPEQPDLWDAEPGEGTFPADLAAKLAAALGPHTATPDRCWFAVWDGWGDLEFSSLGAPTFQLPGRNYFLFAGPLSAAKQSLGGALGEDRPANLWWPNDRAWCVATEIDLNSTYIGGSDVCTTELLTTAGLEVVRASLTDGIQWDTDRINPPSTA